jgi:tetraacyldisaccharide 4'-kinase
MIKQLRLLTLPFSWLYGLVTCIRNKLYDWQLLESVKFDLPLICVGNLVVGGAGKTPVTEYLVGLLKANKIAILSRGYGRKTKGFILADEQATAAIIGDEPMQYYKKFPGITVAVCEDRVKGIRMLEKDHDLIILDDAFQHRRVQPGYSVLLFEFGTLIKRQFLLPAGNLREYFSNYKRADVILVTKTPIQSAPGQKDHCRQKFDSATRQHLFFSQIGYQALKPVFTEQAIVGVESAQANLPEKKTTVFLLTGIANSRSLTDYLDSRSARLVHHQYGDHYQFSRSDIMKLVNAYRACADKEKIIVTTEKDTQRLLDDSLRDLLVNLPVFYLPIKIEIQEEDKAIFDQKILNYVSSARHNHTL